MKIDKNLLRLEASELIEGPIADVIDEWIDNNSEKACAAEMAMILWKLKGYNANITEKHKEDRRVSTSRYRSIERLGQLFQESGISEGKIAVEVFDRLLGEAEFLIEEKVIGILNRWINNDSSRISRAVAEFDKIIK